MVKTIRHIHPYLLIVLFLPACMPAVIPTRHYDALNPIKRVALLPMQNDTLDIDGPLKVRERMAEAFKNRGYNIKPLEESDSILRDQMGINLGGQLSLTTPEKLGEVLGVEGVLYGTLMDYDDKTTGVLNVKKVRGKFRLVNVMTGETVWERGLGVKSEMRMGGLLGDAAAFAANISDSRDKEVPWVTIQSESSNRSFGETLAIGLASKLIEKTMGVSLERETRELAARVTNNLQWGPGPAALESLSPVSRTIPEIKPPKMPLSGYIDYGRKDFSALMVTTTRNKSNGETLTAEIQLARSGDNTRLDIDFSAMRGGQGLPAQLAKMTSLHRRDKKESYSMYPNSRRYLVHKEADEGYIGDIPEVKKILTGKEKLGEYMALKYKVKVIYRSGQVEEGFIWNSVDLGGMTIKSEFEENDTVVSTEIRNIVMKPPDPSLFTIPSDFTEAKSIMELMGP